MKEWIEVERDVRAYAPYQLKCPVCGYTYSPNSALDGTISPLEIHKFCPKCGEQLDDPAKDTRY